MDPLNLCSLSFLWQPGRKNESLRQTVSPFLR